MKIPFLSDKEEKKVEYLELIYDLIFVYIIGRNNSLLHELEGGFVTGSVFLAYILCSLAIIQIWNYSTLYINLYGRNGVRDHVFLFVNMYLLYYMGEGIRVHWATGRTQFLLAWALILINIGVQYLIEKRNHRFEPWTLTTINGTMLALFGEAGIVFAAIPAAGTAGTVLTSAAVFFGILITWLFVGRSGIRKVDFPHLTERAMLYVVFTFGEMIIAIAVYFEDGFSMSSLYFSTMSFIIAVGLFLCYEIMYNRVVDRNLETNGMAYMLIHIFLIFGLNLITTSLEFMQNPEVMLWPKALLLIFSFLLFFTFLFVLLVYAKAEMKICIRFLRPVLIISALFVVLMILFREKMYVNILVTVVYIFALFFLLFRFSWTQCRANVEKEEL